MGLEAQVPTHERSHAVSGPFQPALNPEAVIPACSSSGGHSTTVAEMVHTHRALASVWALRDVDTAQCGLMTWDQMVNGTLALQARLSKLSHRGRPFREKQNQP